jgi:hypothetical protein|nr:MAG TPA: hypothetical protein [Caudoviricetes sp.]DAO20486.1 MAG TPA: hypothetical protein [Caudoviricetes sp.]
MRTNEERLYKLAHECLLEKWCKAYKNARDYPICEFFNQKEKELWNELCNFENEMKLKGIKF